MTLRSSADVFIPAGLQHPSCPALADEAGCHRWKQSLLGKQPVAQIAVCVSSEDGWLFELPLGYC